MTFVKINETLYPATISGRVADNDWDNRESKSITLEMDYATAIDIFADGLEWSIIQCDGISALSENSELTAEPISTEFDNSEYNIAGDIVDHRNGYITAKMGKQTAEEILTMIMEGLAL